MLGDKVVDEASSREDAPASLLAKNQRYFGKCRELAKKEIAKNQYIEDKLDTMSIDPSMPFFPLICMVINLKG